MYLTGAQPIYEVQPQPKFWRKTKTNISSHNRPLILPRRLFRQDGLQVFVQVFPISKEDMQHFLLRPLTSPNLTLELVDDVAFAGPLCKIGDERSLVLENLLHCFDDLVNILDDALRRRTNTARR